ncbi:MAG: hypothetical protein R2715_22905 [Ilumatobacteraceae bacterium]
MTSEDVSSQLRAGPATEPGDAGGPRSGLVGAIVVNTLSAELDRIPGLATIGLYLGNLALNVAVAALAFHVLTDRATHWRELAPGALFAGVACFMSQVFGRP